MNDHESPQNDTTEEPKEAVEASQSSPKKSKKPSGILLVPYPKFVFLYPTLIATTLAAIILTVGGYHSVNPEQTVPVVVTGLFLVVMMANMFVIVFDFPRATSLTLVFIVTSVLLGLWMLVLGKPDFLPSIEHLVTAVRPAANATFFSCISVAMILMYGAIFISVRFNYWELRQNELLHHHGMLSDLKRYPARTCASTKKSTMSSSSCCSVLDG